MPEGSSGNRISQGARTATLCIPLVLIVGLSQPAVAAAGALDTTFSGDGKVTTSFGSNADAGAASVAIQTDGKIVVAGSRGTEINGRFALTRYGPNGTLDSTFSGDGRVTTAFGSYAGATSVAIQTDGKIVAAGWKVSGSNTRFALARYNSNGTLDTSFSGDGKAATLIGSSAGAVALVIQPDAKIVAAGRAVLGGNERFALARYNPNGSLDTSFSGDGKLATAFGSYAGAASLAIQPDAKIVAAGSRGSGSSRFALARYNPNGNLDTSFSGDGKLTTPIGSYAAAAAVAIQADGRIVAAGYRGGGSSRFALARYNPNGSLDTSFSGDGKLTTAFGSSANATSVAIQADGRIVAAGDTTQTNTGVFALVRYDPNGSLDTSFSGDGKLTTPIGSSANASSVAIQADGRIVAAGSAANGVHYRFAVIRYEGS